MKAEENERAPVVLPCSACRWSDKTSIRTECRSPQQRGYADKLGAGDATFWPSVSIARSYDCHGAWWEARLPKITAAQRGLFAILRRVKAVLGT